MRVCMLFSGWVVIVLTVASDSSAVAGSKPSPSAAVKADSPTPFKTLGINLTALIPHVGDAIEKARMLDEHSTSVGPISGQTGTPRIEATHVVVTFRVPDVERSRTLSNTVVGFGLPGRSMTNTIRVDCLVHGWIEPGLITASRESTSTERVTVRVPDFTRLTSSFPDGHSATFRTAYGSLRAHAIDAETAAAVRRGLYDDALAVAVEEVRGQLSATNGLLARELVKTLQQAYPSNHVTATTSPDGGVNVAIDFGPVVHVRKESRGDDGFWSVLWVMGIVALLVIALGYLSTKKRVRVAMLALAITSMVGCGGVHTGTESPTPTKPSRDTVN